MKKILLAFLLLSSVCFGQTTGVVADAFTQALGELVVEAQRALAACAVNKGDN